MWWRWNPIANIGKRFGRLLIIWYMGGWNYDCLCDCGRKTESVYNRLNIWKKRSCWCLQKEIVSELWKRMWKINWLKRKKRWVYGTKLYVSWAGMKQNVRKQNLPIDECFRKSESFYSYFIWEYNALEKKWVPPRDIIIVRKDLSKWYTKENIHLGTMKELVDNKTKKTVYKWELLSNKEIAKKMWVAVWVIAQRKYRGVKWSDLYKEKVDRNRYLTLESGEVVSVKDMADKTWINRKTLTDRIDKHLYTADEAITPWGLWAHSKFENEILEFVRENYKWEIISWSTVLWLKKEKWGRDIDIYLPELKIGIECNWYFYHSRAYLEKYMSWNSVYKYFHYNKKRAAETIGIDLFFIWEWQRQKNKDIMKDFILKKIGVYWKKIGARECEQKRISILDLQLLCEKNHIMWENKLIHEAYWLFYWWYLVSGMWLNKKNWAREMSRYVTKSWYSISWWFNKLLSMFLKDHPVDSLTTYANYDYVSFKNNIYEKNWFHLESIDKDSNFFVIDSNRKEMQRFFSEYELKEQGIRYKEINRRTFRGKDISSDEMKWVYECYNAGIWKYVKQTKQSLDGIV